MVCYEHVHVNADVEILREGFICRGKVRWKGRLLGKSGSWVGVELYLKAGSHNGTCNGVQYFKCPDGYGIFIKASQLRFPPSRGRSYSAYRTVSKISFVDEGLFGRQRTNDKDETEKCIKVPKIYVSSARDLFREKAEINERKTFPLNHPIGGRVMAEKTPKSNTLFGPAKITGNDIFTTREQPRTLKKSVSCSLIFTYRNNHTTPFVSPPSIPKVHGMSKKEQVFI